MAKIKVNRKQKYILVLMIISLCLIVILNSCGNVTRNIGYGLSEIEIEERYRKAELMYNAILDGEIRGSQDNWNKLIKQLNDIIDHHPKSQVADDALYSLGLCYIWSEGDRKDSLRKAIKAFDRLTYYYPKSELIPSAYYWRAYAYLGLEDYKRAILEFERFRVKFPKSPLYADAEYQLNECRAKVGEKKEPVIAKDADTSSQKKAKSEKNNEEKASDEKKEQVIKKEEKKVIPDIAKPPEITPDVKPPIKNDQPPPKKDDVKVSRLSVKEIRYSSSPEYTRVVIDSSQSARYDTLKLSDPERLCVNIQNAVLSTSKQDIIVDDALIKKIRSAQFDLETVRVVLDLKAIKNYKVFDLKDPFRIVIDVFGQPNQNLDKPIGTTFPKQSKEPSVTVIPRDQSPNLVKQLGLKVRTIVIDPGHGGKDPGAVSKSGLYEKHFVLDISKRLRDLLKSKG
ncbi:TPA: AMIN domain-containing protein, partial [bacterium]|nr:AMIN domain-containing protein [bacterium]